MSIPHPLTPPTRAAHATSSAPPNLSTTGQDLILACHSNQDHPGLRFDREMSGTVADACDYRPVTAKEPATRIRPGQADTDSTGRPYAPAFTAALAGQTYTQLRGSYNGTRSAVFFHF